MRTFLAFKFKKAISEIECLNNVKKVQDYYEETYLNYKLSLDYSIYKNIGAFILDDVSSKLNFPSIIERENIDILTFFPPLNYKDFNLDKNKAMESICINLSNNKNILNTLTSPFMFSAINKDSEELNIYTDTLGVNRLYVLENDKGVFWSNRPSALLIFSNHKAKLNESSWKSYAVAGWFMDNDSPFEDVYRVPPSTVINVSANEITGNLYFNYSTEGIEQLIYQGNENNSDTASLVNSIVTNLNSYIDLWDLNIQADISGGKDSRVSAASVLKTQSNNYSFRTINDIDKELNTSKLLLEKIGNKKDLRVLNPELYINEQPCLSERVDRLLFEYDGDFSTVMISSPIIETNEFNSLKEIKINGFGGEIGKGAYYSNERWIEKLEKIGEGAAYYRLTNHFTKIGCVSEESITIMENKIKNILSKGEEIGINGLKLLDYFHFIERFRRWTPLSGQVHCYSPFINDLFISTALTNEPRENINANMHNEIISYLIPEWSDVKYFKATPEQSKEKDQKKLRLWQTKDKIDIEKILQDSFLWNDVFLEDEVKILWEQAKREGIPNFKETLFHRVAMRARFNSHMKRINRNINLNS